MQVRANYSYIDKFTGWTNCGNTAGSYSGSVIFAQNRSLLEAAHRSNAFYPGRSLPIRKFYALPIARPGDFFFVICITIKKNNYLYAVMVPARYAGQDEKGIR